MRVKDRLSVLRAWSLPFRRRNLRTGAMIIAAICFLPSASPANAAELQVRGKVQLTEGHITPVCRRVFLKRNDTGAVMIFRIADTGTDQSELSIALTGLATGNDVLIDYDPAVTTGCGTEPQIIYISIFAPGAP